MPMFPPESRRATLTVFVRLEGEALMAMSEGDLH